jgi:hypothetical protein
VKRITQLETLPGPDICREEESFPVYLAPSMSLFSEKFLEILDLVKIACPQGTHQTLQFHQVTQSNAKNLFPVLFQLFNNQMIQMP